MQTHLIHAIRHREQNTILIFKVKGQGQKANALISQYLGNSFVLGDDNEMNPHIIIKTIENKM